MNPQVALIIASLPDSDQRRLANSSAKASRLESQYRKRIKAYIDSLAVQSANDLIAYGEIRSKIDFVSLFVEHAFETTAEAMRSAEKDIAYPTNKEKRLGLPKGKVPRSLKDLMALWDAYRQGKYVPKRQKTLGDRIKKAYIKRVQDLWQKHSEDFREGKTYDQDAARRAVLKATDSTVARANIIVDTETTRYYNAARRNVYDLSDNVTHYLFLAVRDAATTKWCTAKTVGGLRGRSGLVYAKGDPLLEKETPPCHYRCRSELLPLSMLNPVHRKLIMDKSIQRRFVRCAPLLPNWNS